MSKSFVERRVASAGFGSRGEAVESLIVSFIEDSGLRLSDFDVDAIADEVLVETGGGWDLDPSLSEDEVAFFFDSHYTGSQGGFGKQGSSGEGFGMNRSFGPGRKASVGARGGGRRANPRRSYVDPVSSFGGDDLPFWAVVDSYFDGPTDFWYEIASFDGVLAEDIFFAFEELGPDRILDFVSQWDQEEASLLSALDAGRIYDVVPTGVDSVVVENNYYALVLDYFSMTAAFFGFSYSGGL